MDKVYKYHHADFRFFIYAQNVSLRQERYTQTLAKRQKEDNEKNNYTLLVNKEEKALESPIFFENMRYEFEWEFNADVSQAEVKHDLAAIVDNFRFNARTKTLQGIIDTGNDIGWFHLPISYEKNGSLHSFELAFEVLPTKMDLHQDLPKIYADIDRTYPLWRFNFAEKTAQSVSKSDEFGNSELLWLAQFQRLQADFAKALNIITNSPHNRLQAVEKQQKIEKIKGKVPERTAMKIRNDMANGIYYKRYAITEKHLSVDTPENRFIKMIVNRSLQTLEKIDRTLSNKTDQSNRLSSAFFDRLRDWQKPIKQMKHQPFMQQVSEFQGFQKESLVLQQRTGYSKVFQIWQELKYYLNAFEKQTKISQKSIDKIYEVWCFLTLRQCLLDLGFEEKWHKNISLQKGDDFSLKMKDGFYRAFHFEKEKIKVKLVHEPIFTKNNTAIKSFITTQKPDILLEIIFENKQRYIWLFDAKYRIKTDKEPSEEENIDFVPDDAINQMHRYRDALIRLNENSLANKTRPVFGAFALYPGFFDQKKIEGNPYFYAIENVGIGAFALLPNENGTYWLTEFLREKLLTLSMEQFFIQPEARIANNGMQQRLYSNLVLMMSLGKNRSEEYLSNFLNGKAKWYHTPKRTIELKYANYVASEIQFLALAQNEKIERLWPIKQVTLVPRHQITLEQSGTENQNDEPYYLFELGKSLLLEKPIYNVPELDEQGKGFRQSMKLTTLDKLDDVVFFDDIETVYIK